MFYINESSSEYHMAQPERFSERDNCSELHLKVLWPSPNSDPPWQFKTLLEQFLTEVTVKKISKTTNLFLQNPETVLEDPLARKLG